MRHHTAARWAARLRWTVTSAFMVLAAAALLTARQKPADDDSFDALYRRGSEINATFKTLTARFTETTTSSILTRPLVASGVVAVERPSRVVLHYHQPEMRDVLIDGDRLTVSWPGRHIRDVTNIAAANRRIQKYFLDSSPAQLRESFDIVSERADDRPRTYRLTMVPRRKQIRDGLSRQQHEYSPSRRNSAPSSPGFLHASACFRIRSRYSALNRRRWGLAGTSGSGSAARSVHRHPLEHVLQDPDTSPPLH